MASLAHPRLEYLNHILKKAYEYAKEGLLKAYITYQLIVYVTDTHLCGELRASDELPVKYHIKAENEHFVRRDGEVYRRGQVYRICVDKKTGNELSRELIRDNNAKVMYDTSNLIVLSENIT